MKNVRHFNEYYVCEQSIFPKSLLAAFWHLFIDWHWEIFSKTIIKFLHIHLQFKCSSANELADLLFWKISTGKKIINFIHWTWFYKLSDFLRTFKKQTNQFWLDIILYVGLRTTRIEYHPEWIGKEKWYRYQFLIEFIKLIIEINSDDNLMGAAVHIPMRAITSIPLELWK